MKNSMFLDTIIASGLVNRDILDNFIYSSEVLDNFIYSSEVLDNSNINLAKFYKKYKDKVDNISTLLEILGRLVCNDEVSGKYKEEYLDFIFDTFRNKNRISYVLDGIDYNDLGVFNYDPFMGRNVWVNGIEYFVHKGGLLVFARGSEIEYAAVVSIEKDLKSGNVNVITVGSSSYKSTKSLESEKDKIKIIFK